MRARKTPPRVGRRRAQHERDDYDGGKLGASMPMLIHTNGNAIAVHRTTSAPIFFESSTTGAKQGKPCKAPALRVRRVVLGLVALAEHPWHGATPSTNEAPRGHTRGSPVSVHRGMRGMAQHPRISIPTRWFSTRATLTSSHIP